MMEMVITRRDGSDNGTPIHIWEITDDRGVAADLIVNATTHEIGNIDVRADRRREGLARALYEAACREMTVFHAPIAHRSDEGKLFAQAMGGPTIEAYDCDCAACDVTEDDEEQEW